MGVYDAQGGVNGVSAEAVGLPQLLRSVGFAGNIGNFEMLRRHFGQQHPRLAASNPGWLSLMVPTRCLTAARIMSSMEGRR